VRQLSTAREQKVKITFQDAREPQLQVAEQARWLWETTRGEAENDNEAIGLLLAQIVVELQSVQTMMSASVSRLRS
jgi:hypothetical protein